MKEQSSTSTQKIHLPNKDLVGLKRSEEQKEVTTVKTKLPKPTGWRMLVLPFRMDEKTKKFKESLEKTIDKADLTRKQKTEVLMTGFGKKKTKMPGMVRSFGDLEKKLKKLKKK